MTKELHMAEVERIMTKLMDQGMSEDEAYDRASDLAYDAMRDRLADMADAADAREGRAEMSTSGLKPATRSEAEVRAARDMRERAAHTCDLLGDTAFAEIAKKGNDGMATIAQRHYMRCASAIRNLPLFDGTIAGAGTTIANALASLVAGIEDMRRRGVIDEENDDQFLDSTLAEAKRALKLVGAGQ